MGRVMAQWLGIAAGLAVLAGSAEGQRRHDRYDGPERYRQPAGYVGFGVVAADAIGELGYFIDQGVGGQFEGAFPVDGSGFLRIRGDFGFIIYGHERLYMCFSTPFGCRIGSDLTTTNSILFGGLGPEITLARGAIEPYVNATFGFSYFATTSSLEDDYGYDWANTTNFSDAMFAWRAGGGVRLRIKGGRKPIHLDFGAERHENGIAEFLTEGDIVDNPDGSITLYPNRSEANLVTYRVGLTFGIPSRRGRR